ncbi:unnamed protein product [Ilex paraguariensis]|uniref:BZIP domain-containing protein n=1 Tax=Ilex paraguariensis TaxID=185542 RepID=A0ABC8U8Y6_9AQUA
MDVCGDHYISEGRDWDWDWDLDHLLDNFPLPSPEDLIFFDIDVDPSSLPDVSSVNQIASPSPDSALPSFAIGDIEQLLMKDDDRHSDKSVAEDPLPMYESCNAFLSDILLHSPVESHRSAEVIDVSESDCKNSNDSEEDEDKIHAGERKNNENNNEDCHDDDPISKKRKRQLRNRDAAMKSRERKKMYVKDLEMKSRYYEAECKRLGMVLQCCFAENQALRLSLQNTKAFDAYRTKQESAVLVLESLLLGSLLWFLGITCLFILPSQLQSTLLVVPMENVDNKSQEGLVQRKAGSENFGLLVFQSFMMSKRCKASRSRMKPSSPAIKLLV